jgi:drug/metabolite transporter (DMT)-like permease
LSSSVLSPALALETRRNLLIGVALAFFGAIAFSAKAIFVKLAYRYGVDPETLIALRMVLALPFFLGAAVWVNRKSGSQAALQKGDWWRITLIGLSGYYLSSYIDFLGLQYVTASLERLILYLNPTMVLLASVWFFKRPVSGRQVLALIISYVGVMISLLYDFRLGGSNVLLGSALVFLSALTYTIYMLASGEIVKRIGSIRLTAYASMVACVACIVQFLVMRPMSALVLPVEVYWLSVMNALISTVLPIFMVMTAIARVGAPLTSQVGLVGPVSTMLLGAIFLGESIGLAQMAGTALVLAGVYVVTRPGTRSGPDEK